MMKSSFLLTGFEPFQGQQINPSKEIINFFQKNSSVSTLLLPVSYDRSWQVLQNYLQNEPTSFVLMLGQAAGRSRIGLEKVALNLQDSVASDEDGVQRLDQVISAIGPEAIFSHLPLREWASVLNNKGRSVEVSLNAGAFVCNSLYYQLSESFAVDSIAECLFVHLPFLNEQVLPTEPEVPGLPLEEMVSTIQNLIELIEM